MIEIKSLNNEKVFDLTREQNKKFKYLLGRRDALRALVNTGEKEYLDDYITTSSELDLLIRTTGEGFGLTSGSLSVDIDKSKFIYKDE